jgi:rhomboid family GlyGly-CTERM serine protease
VPTRIPFLTLLLAALAVAIHLLPEFVTTGLQFERGAFAGGEWWRFISAHLTHFDSNHLAWDVAALLVLGTLVETTSRRAVAIALGVASIAIPAAIWAWQPQFETYRGLSGLDSALFGLFATSLIQRRRRPSVMLGIIALLGVGAKCSFELATGSTAFATGTGYAPVPLAHLVGVGSGVIAGIIGCAWQKPPIDECVAGDAAVSGVTALPM